MYYYCIERRMPCEIYFSIPLFGKLKNYENEKDVLTCFAFGTLFRKL